MNKKSGFGLIEVMAAAVVLGFLIVGLNILQKGNRESILRVRARDAANFVAQHVLDSLGSIGINSLVADANNLVFKETNYTYKTGLAFDVKVALLNNADCNGVQCTIDSTNFAKATNRYAKNLEATVSWLHKSSTQSIKMAKVVR